MWKDIRISVMCWRHTDDGAPRFRHDDDNVTVPEAFLFHDDLSLPTGRIAWMIGALERAWCRSFRRYVSSK
jgi:hypothetical protein